MAYKFKRGIVGGTFDHLHAGHQKLLTTAFEQSAYIVIGVATNDLFQHKVYAELIEDFATRKAAIEKYLTAQRFTNRYEITPLKDFYGTSLTDKFIEAIFITESNLPNVKKMNEARAKRGFLQMEPVIVQYVLDENQNLISSQDIRKGQINRLGKSYLSLLQKQGLYLLPPEERKSLRVPIGALYPNISDIFSKFSKKTMYIAVGDIVSKSLLNHGAQAAISIVDGKTRRNEKIEGTKELSQNAKEWHANNEAGTITSEAVDSIQSAIQAYMQTHEKQLLIVSGEEDLLAIPAILLSPLHSVVVYGLFGKGIVAVEVTEQNKQDVQELFRKFQ